MIQKLPPIMKDQGASAPSFVDLFCGCGGFTLGMLRAGFLCAAVIDSDADAIATLQSNLPALPNVLRRDLTRYRPSDLAELIGRDRIDVIVGGPPCQGFSTARQVDGANHGARLTDDPRRHLYREFLKYIDFFQPSVFVIENVLGMRNAANGEYFTRVQHEARTLGKNHGRPGYRVHAQIEDAAALGVPQKRRRQLIVGVRADLPGYFIPELAPAPSAIAPTTLGEAIGDLPVVRAGSGQNERDYDLVRRANHLNGASKTARNYLFNVLEIERATNLTNHVARPHSDRDLRDFSRLREGETSAVAMRDRGVKFEFPYDKSSFKDRYTRQSRKGQCSTIVAHLSKDGLMFIHPTQNRSITPREAARIQSFPDWFRFPEARTHAFRLIGNAVPPLVAESVGTAIARFLREIPQRGAKALDHTAPRRTALVAKLSRLASLKRNHLRAVKKQEFLEGWQALLILFPDLHPINALDHGAQQSASPELALLLPELESQGRRRYLRSGWPVALEIFGREAWRRRNGGELSLAEFYSWVGGHSATAEHGRVPTP
jgi:DNA (cytosine-5)-methyltransferase 1